MWNEEMFVTQYDKMKTNQNKYTKTFLSIYGEQSDTKKGCFSMYLFIYRLFNDAVGSSDYRMIGWLVNNELWRM
jgi:hypothetical protein